MSRHESGPEQRQKTIADDRPCEKANWGKATPIRDVRNGRLTPLKKWLRSEKPTERTVNANLAPRDACPGLILALMLSENRERAKA